MSQSYQVKVIGVASGKTLWEGPINQEELAMTGLEWLQSKSIPVASSCFGEGICERCIINQSVISCTVTLRVLFAKRNTIEITIDYL